MERKQRKDDPKVEEDYDEAFDFFEDSLLQIARLRNQKAFIRHVSIPRLLATSLSLESLRGNDGRVRPKSRTQILDPNMNLLASQWETSLIERIFKAPEALVRIQEQQGKSAQPLLHNSAYKRKGPSCWALMPQHDGSRS
jgi:hypothetical protein